MTLPITPMDSDKIARLRHHFAKDRWEPWISDGISALCDLATSALSETKERVALREFCTAFENRGETTSLKEWNDRMKAAHANALEALAGREPYSEPK